MTRPGRAVGVSPLHLDDVVAVLAARVTQVPRTTEEITDLCQAAHPGVPGITTLSVSRWLRFLHRREKVRKYSGKDRDMLIPLGVPEPHVRSSYWLLRTGQQGASDAAPG